MPLPATPALAADLAALAARLRASTVAVHVGGRTRRGTTPAGQGSGVVWQADGLIVTNAHVARSADAQVTLGDGRHLTARLVARDPARDLALLRVEADDLTPATPTDPSTLPAGTLVFAFGHPLGTANALSAGILHATSATPAPWMRGAQTSPPARFRLVQADIRLQPGNSGGPLADAAGRVLGINTLIANELGVAIATPEVVRFVERHTRATSAPPQLGIAIRPALVRNQGAPDRSALLVLEVAPNTAAARAGLLPGDVLLTADGAPLTTADDLTDALRHAGSGGTVALAIVRAGRRAAVRVHLGSTTDRAHDPAARAA